MVRARGLTSAVAVLLVIVVGAVAWQYLQSSVADEGAQVGVASAASGDAPGGGSPAVGGEGEPAGTVSSGSTGYTAFDDSGGRVTVDAAVLTPGSIGADPSLGDLQAGLADGEFGILIAFNTHSVDLSAYDPVSSGALRTADGELAPVRWVSESDSSHHRSGVLVFGGLPDLTAAGELALDLEGLAGVPLRTLTWQLPVD